MDIEYVKGDVLDTTSITGNKILIHVCNDVGGFGKGFAKNLANKYGSVRESYKNLVKSRNLILGEVQFVQVENNFIVANMISQHGYKSNQNPVPLRYDALRGCLRKVCLKAKQLGEVTVFGPRIGSGLSGGDWDKIELILVEELTDSDIPVVIFDL